ncbi:cytochrome P450, partial [Colletotrichum scovillei]
MLNKALNTYPRRKMGSIDVQTRPYDLAPHGQADGWMESQGFFDDHLEVRKLLGLVKSDVFIEARAEALGIELFVHALYD